MTCYCVRFYLTPEQAGFGLSAFNLRDTIISDSCPAEPACTGDLASAAFRSLDGSCNNLRRGGWGQSKTQFQRALAAQYADGTITQNLNQSKR
jgi:peroxidase